jgi:hypothetical protein
MAQPPNPTLLSTQSPRFVPLRFTFLTAILPKAMMV